MFSQVLLKLTCSIFLFMFCVSTTSATPSGQHEEAQNINEDIHARADPTRPYQCDDPFTFVRRECVGANGPGAWQDVCVWNTFGTVYDYKPGNCPVGTICLNGFNKDGFRFITCISEETGKPVSGEKRKTDPQIGMSDIKRGRTEIGNTQQKFSVAVDHDMTGAAVAAVFESRCRTFNVQCHMFLCSKGMSGIN